MNDNYIPNLKNLVEFSSSLIYLSDYENMTNLLDTSFNKNYFEYSKIIYNTLCPNKFINNKIYLNDDVSLTNPFNNLLFVVQDKEALIKSISDKGYTISQGSKQ
jgi:hypothetical protein